MQANSRPVASPQSGPHRDLAARVLRHAGHAYRKPAAPYSIAAFARFRVAWDGVRAPILDAGCGTGASTCAIARAAPDRLVVGVDQSAARLGRGIGTLPGNALLLRADVVDFWLLLKAHGVGLDAHYLLYPNPWPKPSQLMRRWPAHPAFPTVLELGGRLECRSNWGVYIEEFAAAVTLLTGRPVEPETFVPAEPLTPFERKYRDSGHALRRARVDLPGTLSPAMP